MQLYDEIYEGVAEARCSFLPLGGGYFQGVRALGGFSDTEILLQFKKNTVIVRGEQLEIKKYCDGDLQLSGKIFSVSLQEGEKN